MSENVIVTFIASVLIWFMYFGIFVLWVIDGKFKKEAALHALIASFLAWSLSNIIKDFFPTLRPFQINGNPTMVIIPPLDGAFPSSHAAASFAMAVTVWLHTKKWGIVFLLSALAIGIARVIGNVHYPIDILGGALLGVIFALSVERVHVFSLLTKLTKLKS
jgi:undecaprenyl-diphosphatase